MGSPERVAVRGSQVPVARHQAYNLRMSEVPAVGDRAQEVSMHSKRV